MRTTLDIDPDVLDIVRKMAALHKTTAGKVISELVRRGLHRVDAPSKMRNGVPLLPPRSGERPVSMDLVNGMRD